MKLNLVSSLLLLILYTPFAFSKKDMGILYVKITKIKNTKGSLKIALIDKETKITNKEDLEGAVRIGSVSVSDKTMKYQIKKLPYGKYSFIVFHDENNNDQLDLDLFDAPLEGFGYSNNPKVKQHKPSFKESSFEINQKKQKITVEMNYL